MTHPRRRQAAVGTFGVGVGLSLAAAGDYIGGDSAVDVGVTFGAAVAFLALAVYWWFDDGGADGQRSARRIVPVIWLVLGAVSVGIGLLSVWIAIGGG